MVNRDYQKKLQHNREMADLINRDLVMLLEKRAELVEEIGRLKAENGKNIYDRTREQQIYENLCAKTSLPEWYVKSVFKAIIEGAKKIEEEQRQYIR